MLLRLEEAKGIAEDTIEKAGEFDIKISVAVCEAGGKLLVFKRMDGIAWAGVYGSKRKALASAAFNLSSGRIPGAQSHNHMQITRNEGGHMIIAKGAAAIYHDGDVVGACGVFGGAEEQDEACARANIAKVAPYLPPKKR